MSVGEGLKLILLSLALAGSFLAGCITPTNPTIPQGDAGKILGPALGFAKSVLIDKDHPGGEPSIAVDSKNHYYVSAPSGMVTPWLNIIAAPGSAADQHPLDRQSYLWKSENEGTSWKLITITPPPLPPLKGDATFGGGDTDLAIDDCDTVYFTDLWAGNAAVSHSRDGGKSWTGVPITGLKPSIDRQWLATDGCGKVYLGYQSFEGGQIWVIKSTDYGLTWPTQRLVLNCPLDQGEPTPLPPPCYGRPGNLIVDPATHNVYLALSGRGGYGTQVAVSTDGGDSWNVVKSSTTKGKVDNDFVVIANDAAGTLYQTWSELQDGSFNVYLSVSTDQATTWSAPRALAGPENVGTEVFPWIAAGDAGKVAVVWYGAAETAATTDDVKGDWFVYMAASEHADDPAGAWTVALVSDKPMHKGDICTRGTDCVLKRPINQGGNRNLADFFEVAIDQKGRAVTTWADDYESAATLRAWTAFGRQSEGLLFLTPKSL